MLFRRKKLNILMFVAQPYCMTLNLFEVNDSLAHEGITCFTITLPLCQLPLLYPIPNLIFHLFTSPSPATATAIWGFFRKSCMRRRLLILKWPSLSRQSEITGCFNPSVLLILHPLFATFSPLFDLDDDTPPNIWGGNPQKLGKLLVDDGFDWWSGLVNFF
jgi:hypothetical protein